MPGEPILGKRHPTNYDHRPMTWPVFLVLRTWAKEAAERTGLPVYLVGSALAKAKPRDVDVSFVMPVEQLVRRFGTIPEPGSDAMKAYQVALHKGIVDEVMNAQEALVDNLAADERVMLDIKLTPDTWWPEKDRLLLAGPARS